MMTTPAHPGASPLEVQVATSPASTADDEFVAYVELRRDALLRTAYLISGESHTAEDLVQNALAKLYLAWNRRNQIGNLDAYARRMIVNEYNSLWRRPFQRRETPTEFQPGGVGDRPVNPTHGDGTQEAVWDFVASLPRKQRTVVVLRYYEDMSDAEIAETLGISVGTVKSQASRALAALRARAPQTLKDPS